MRIYSSFRDYYDGAAMAYHDQEPRYERQERVLLGNPDGSGVPLSTHLPVPVQEALIIAATMPRPDTMAWTESGATVVVACGKVYPVYTGFKYQGGNIVALRASLRGEDVVPPQYWAPKDYMPWLVNGKARPPKIPTWHCSLNEAGWAKFQQVITQCGGAHELNILYRCPIVRVLCTRSGYKLIGDPNLGAISFQQIVSAPMMAQELEMYLSNQLAVQKDPIPVRTNELIRDAHGFDEHSFRNTKPDRRRRKRR